MVFGFLLSVVNNGIILQYGRFVTSQQNLTIYLPMSYTTRNYSVFIQIIGNTWFMERIVTKYEGNFTITFDYSAGSYLNYPHIFWFTIGF